MRHGMIIIMLFGLGLMQAACGDSGSAPERSDTAGVAMVTLPSSTVVIGDEAKVLAYRPDGRLAWTFSLPGGDTIKAAPVAALSSVTYVRGRQELYAIGPDGTLLWQYKHQGGNDAIHGITPLTDSTVALTIEDRSLVALSSEGKPRWTWNLPENEKIIAGPVLTASSIVYLRTAKNLYAVDSSGNLSWSAEIGVP